jgi:hypothetical protein
MNRFFDDYKNRPENSYPREFLETTFPDWKDWREYTEKSDDAKGTFCRETAYILMNRAMFARIVEDKEIVNQTRLSGRGMAEAVARGPRPDQLRFLFEDKLRAETPSPVSAIPPSKRNSLSSNRLAPNAYPTSEKIGIHGRRCLAEEPEIE